MILTKIEVNNIKVYFNDKAILVLDEYDFGIEVYDYVNHKDVPVKSSWLKGAYEEVQPYVDALIAGIEKNPDNSTLDIERKSVLEQEIIMRKEIGLNE